jgi:hypothetical protein
MQEWNSECEKKVKKEKYLKYIWEFYVKYWNGKCDWSVHAINNKIK